MTLRTRLFSLVAAVVVFTTVAVTLAMSASARSAFAAWDAQRTSALVAEVQREVTRRGEEAARQMERIAETEQFRRLALDLGAPGTDRSQYVREAGAMASAYDLDILDIVAADGTIVSSAHWPARFGYPHTWATMSESARTSHGAFLRVIETPEGSTLAAVAARRVPTAGGDVILAGGRTLDARFVESLALPAGVEVRLERNTGRDVAGQSTETVHATPLAGRDGEAVATLVVTTSRRELTNLLERIRWMALGVGAAAIVLGFVLSYFIASRVTRPVEQLAEGARAVSSGDWDVELDVRASGEIGALGSAFNTMTRQLADQRERLVQAERVAAWRELARRLAHELKNPLFPLRITIDNLRRAKADHPREFNDVFEESMMTLSTGLGNLTSVVGKFSDFARMPQPRLETTAANEIVQQVVQLFRAQAAAPGRPVIAIETELDPSAGDVRVDPEQIGRALQNLVLNAIDAMPTGGTLTVRTHRIATGVRFEVADTGEGLLEEERQRLFTPYYTTKQHGTGLGLAIVQSVVADHRGKIWVESERSRGTTFYIELPA
jgi:two-component system, NtrC family, nitrogen regulation sensor histidine kinase NtrY